MIKYIYYLILCGTLLLYCCGESNTMFAGNKTTNGSNTTSNTTPADIQTSKQQMFNTLMHAFKKIIENNQQWSMEKKERYKQFEIWLLQDTQKQKQLTEHFKYLYTLLEENKPQSASNITIKQLIGNTIDCVSSNKCEGRNDVYSNDRSETFTIGNIIKTFFENLLSKMLDIPNNTNINQEMFKYINSELIDPKNNIAQYTSSYNEFLKLRFNDNQIKTLDLLARTIRPNYIEMRVSHPKYVALTRTIDSILKPVLDYVYNELQKCIGNQQSINNFKNELTNYFKFNEVNDELIIQLPNKVIIKCGR